jgi:hypothetical protein
MPSKGVTVDWTIPDRPWLVQIVFVGESVTFTYSGDHNVYLHPSGNCNQRGRILVGSLGQGSATYKFKTNAVGKVLRLHVILVITIIVVKLSISVSCLVDLTITKSNTSKSTNSCILRVIRPSSFVDESRMMNKFAM